MCEPVSARGLGFANGSLRTEGYALGPHHGEASAVGAWTSSSEGGSLFLAPLSIRDVWVVVSVASQSGGALGHRRAGLLLGHRRGADAEPHQQLEDYQRSQLSEVRSSPHSACSGFQDKGNYCPMALANDTGHCFHFPTPILLHAAKVKKIAKK